MTNGYTCHLFILKILLLLKCVEIKSKIFLESKRHYHDALMIKMPVGQI